MSTIKVDNIRIASESVSRPVTGVAAAFCSIASNSTLNTTSLNASSFTDNGTGSGFFDFVSALTAPSFKVGVASQINAAGAGAVMRGTSSGSTTARYDIRTYDSTNVQANTSYMSVVIHGDLA